MPKSKPNDQAAIESIDAKAAEIATGLVSTVTDLPGGNVGSLSRANVPDTDVPMSLPSCVPGHDGRLYPRQGAGLKDCPTNLDLTTTRGKAIIMSVGNPSDMDFRDEQRDDKGRRFLTVEATHFIVFPDSGIDPESGEIKEYARTVFIRADGRFFRTTSAHAPHRIAAALDLYTAEEWAKGIPFRITERPSARHKGGVYHDIRVEV